MSRPGPDGAFFNRLRRAPVRLLMLDFDGTLAPFSERRNKVEPYSGVVEALADIVAKSGQV